MGCLPSATTTGGTMCALVIGHCCSTLRNGSNSNFGSVTIVAARMKPCIRMITIP